MSIDWSKAKPSDTGAVICCFDTGSRFKRGDVQFVPSDDPLDAYSLGPDAWEYVERPKPWTGEGLPPAWTVCEHRRVHEWQKVEVFAVKPNYNGSHTALFTYESGCWGGCAEPSLFRPIRTPEQIAADEREAKAKAMYLSIYFGESEGAWDRQPETSRETFRLAIDAGWQRVAP